MPVIRRPPTFVANPFKHPPTAISTYLFGDCPVEIYGSTVAALPRARAVERIETSTTATHTDYADPGMLASLLSEEAFFPPESQSLAETGVSSVVIETLIIKLVLQVGSTTDREIANQLCLPFGILEDLLLALRSRQVLVNQGQAALNDYYYALTDQGSTRARAEPKCGNSAPH
jgi:hypothetical protein